jgi:hypothetical protein
MFYLLLSLRPSVHPSLGFTGLGYVFSVRAANWCACIQTSLKSAGMLIHWQPWACGTSESAGAALNSFCRIENILARHALKKYTQPLYYFCPSNFPISNFQYLFYRYFRTSEPLRYY